MGLHLITDKRALGDVFQSLLKISYGFPDQRLIIPVGDGDDGPFFGILGANTLRVNRKETLKYTRKISAVLLDILQCRKAGIFSK